MTESMNSLDITKDKDLVRELCLRSFWFFINLVILQTLPDTEDNPRFPLQPFHKEYCDFISDKSIKRAGSLLPRYFGKTTFGTQALPIWLYLNDHESRILIVAETHDKAKGFMHSIKQQIENNEILHYLFPEIKVAPEWKRENRWSSEEADLPREGIYPAPTLKCIGVGGAAQGYHGTDIILDDIIGKNAMMSETIRHDVEIWFNNVTELLVSPDHNKIHGSRIRIIGTNYAPGDIYQKVQKERTEFQWIKIRAEDKFGNPTWPDKLDATEIARMKASPSEMIKFYTQMQNSPEETPLADFKPDWLRYYENFNDKDGIPCVWYDYMKETGGEFEKVRREVKVSDLDIRGIIDPAVSEGGVRKTARTAIVLVGTDQGTDRHIVLEAWAQRIGQPSELYAKVWEFQDKYKPRQWGIETFAQQNFILKAICEDSMRREKFLPITELPKDVGSGAKDIRIRGLQDEFSCGKIYIHVKFVDFVGEYLSFPMGSTKDLMDCLGYAKLFWMPQPTKGMEATARQEYQEFVAGRGEMGY